mgnify:FL=1|tara:strand:+ start:1731 stop:1922 length:192 start_codon:yes stop_codon:yes gene_type:complete
MSMGNPVINKTLSTPTRKIKDQPVEDQLRVLEEKIKPFKKIELPGAEDGKRVIGASNIVIPDA